MSSSTSLSALIRKIDDITVSTVDSTVALARSIHEAISGVQKASAEVVLDPSVRSTVQQHIKRTLNNNHYCSGQDSPAILRAPQPQKSIGCWSGGIRKIMV